MTIIWAHTWFDGPDRTHDFVALEDGVLVGRIYCVTITEGPAWFWVANGIEAAPSTVGCALSGHEATRQAAADRVQAAWAMWSERKEAGTA